MDPSPCCYPSPASNIMAETVPKVLLLLVLIVVFFYLGPHPHHGRQALREVCWLFLFLNHLLLSPGIASDLVFIACGKKSIVFASSSSAFGIGTDSVVFFLTSSILYSGVSRSIFATGAFFRSVSFSWALHTFLFFDASSVHHVN